MSFNKETKPNYIAWKYNYFGIKLSNNVWHAVKKQQTNLPGWSQIFKRKLTFGLHFLSGKAQRERKEKRGKGEEMKERTSTKEERNKGSDEKSEKMKRGNKHKIR